MAAGSSAGLVFIMLLVAAALQGVLQFQPQLRGQRGQVRPLTVAGRGLLVAGDELRPGQGGRVLSSAGDGE